MMIYHVSCLKLLFPSNQPQVVYQRSTPLSTLSTLWDVSKQVDGEQIQAMKRGPLVVWGDIGDENPTQLYGDYI